MCSMGVSESRATKDHLVFRLVNFVLGTDKSGPAKGEGEEGTKTHGTAEQHTDMAVRSY